MLRLPLVVSVTLLLILPALASADMRAQYQNGWPHITWNGRALTGSLPTPSINITVAGERLPTTPTPSTAEPSRTVYELPQGRLIDTIEPFEPFPNCFVRQLVFENGPDAQRDLVGADFRVAIQGTVAAPQWQAQSFAMVECAPGGPTLCVAFTSDADPWRCKLTSDDGLIAEHHCATAWRLPRGGRATIGSQYIWVVDGDLSLARASAQRWYDAIGLTVADGGPHWLRDCIIYQASAGGNVDSRFSDVGGFDNFACQLDYIADLGCNAFWLMSVLTHKDPDDPPSGWNLYSQTRYDEIDPALGGEAGLTRLVDAMRARGFRIVGEIVPSGGRAQLCAAHPEWWTYQPDGSRRTGFGHALDYSSPGWQAQIGDTIRWLTAEWRFDGYRVDVADGYGINWSSPTNAPHVSRSTRAGSIGMLRTIREAALAGGARAPVVIPEVSMEHPEYARHGQVGYGHAFLWAVQNAWTAAASPDDLRDRIREYLEHERGSLPRDTIMLRCLNNHDTIVSSGRADRRFGVGLQQALTALCTVIDGVPMIYQEQEVGSYSYFRRLFWARRRVPELRRGTADYSAVSGPPSVFAVLRSIGDSHALGLVNLSPEPVEGEIALPEHIAQDSRTTAHDAISGRNVPVRSGRLTWRFDPYGAAILRIGKRPEGKVPPERHKPPSGSDVPERASLAWDAAEDGGRVRTAGLDALLTSEGLDIQSAPQPDGGTRITATAAAPGEGHLSLQVLGVDRWSVDAATGLYEDRLMRRHFPWPEGLYHWQPSYVWGYEPHNLYNHTLPAGRQWQSAVAPLSEDGIIALAGRQGRGILLRDLTTNAMNVVLTDRSELPDAEPYGLTLRFLARDEALSPRWSPAYRKSAWVEMPAEPFAREDEPLQVTFTIAPLKSFDRSLTRPRQLAPLPAAQEFIGSGERLFHHNRLWLVDPNTVTWSGLPLAHAGDYTLWLQLRHSERAPDQTELTEHYHIELDGRVVAFEWARLDAWRYGNGYFGWAKAPVGFLQPGAHSLSVRTSHRWCALSPRSYVSRDPSFRP